MTENTGRSRLVLIALIAVFAAPFAGAWLIYHHTDFGRDSADNSYGDLVVPPVPVPDRRLLDPAGGQQRLHGKWSLVYFLPEDCDRGCRKGLATLLSVRAALAGDAARLQLVAASGSPGVEALPPNVPEAIRKRLLILDHADRADYAAADPVDEGGILLIDPLGNLMMSYPPDSASEGIVDDLKRLLRYSRIG